MTFYKETLGNIEDSTSFDPEQVAEWFMAGEFTNQMIVMLTGEQVDAVAVDLDERWGKDAVDAWDAVSLDHL